MNILLKLKYDGTNYVGWQKQPNGGSIQGVIEDRLTELCGEQATVTGCSRTDSGVHAREYICNFQTTSELEPSVILRAMNATIPKDIAVLSAEYVSDDFNARFAAKLKTYVYQIWNSAVREPFLLNYAYHIKIPLNVENMKLAATQFVGEHDFVGFTTTEGQEKNTVRTITECSVETAKNFITITVTGQSFLHNQVRIIAGTLIQVGLGKIPPEDISRIIKSGDRTQAGPTAPALGLFLEKVAVYEN